MIALSRILGSLHSSALILHALSWGGLRPGTSILIEPSSSLERLRGEPGLMPRSSAHSFGRETPRVERPIFWTFRDSLSISVCIFEVLYLLSRESPLCRCFPTASPNGQWFNYPSRVHGAAESASFSWLWWEWSLFVKWWQPRSPNASSAWRPGETT